MNKKKEFLNKTKLQFFREIKKFQKELKPTNEIIGFASSAIVGEKNYPNLKIHNISNNNIENSFFKTSEIIKKDYNEIIKIKAKNILGSTQSINIKKTNLRIREELENIYKSKKEVEFTSKFENQLKFNKILVNKISGIMGSKNELEKVSANENTKTSKQIEKFTSNDIKSKEAIIKLYERGICEHQIINLLAIGSFGIEFNKKLVPTKWAITAYDQTIEKYLYQKIIKYNPINNYEIYYHENKGNKFLIILIPDTYCFENIETFSNTYLSDFVKIDNKLNKTEPETAGGFFATKMPILEFLKERKKQSSIIAIRIIDGYDLPLGVVFVREKIRECLKNKIFSTSNKNELELFLKLNYPIFEKIFLNSNLIKENKKQKKLNSFFKL